MWFPIDGTEFCSHFSILIGFHCLIDEIELHSSQYIYRPLLSYPDCCRPILVVIALSWLPLPYLAFYYLILMTLLSRYYTFYVKVWLRYLYLIMEYDFLLTLYMLELIFLLSALIMTFNFLLLSCILELWFPLHAYICGLTGLFHEFLLSITS